MNFISAGEKISSCLSFKVSKTKVKLDKNGIAELSEKSETLKHIIEDVFIDSKHPSVEFIFEDKSSHIAGQMITRDGNDILSTQNFRLKSDENISELIPEVTGKSQKAIFNKDNISEVLKENNEFTDYLYALINGSATTLNETRFVNFIEQNVLFRDKETFIKRYLSKIDNPVLEVSEKTIPGGKISAFRLKDGDVVVAQGAFSVSGKSCKKYHISSNHTTSIGYSIDGKNRGTRAIDKLGHKIRQAYQVVGECVLPSRTKAIMQHRYGLDEHKPLSNEKIGYLFGLTGERVRLLINEAKLKLLGQHISSDKLKIYEMIKDVPKYLDKEEAELFKSARKHAILGEEIALSQINTFLEINELRARKAVYNVIHDINPQPKDDLRPIEADEIFVINE